MKGGDGSDRGDDALLSAAQCRMARSALRIGLRELATRARTTPKTLCKFENGTDINPAIKRTVRTALEETGAIFIPPSSGQAGGVCLRAGNTAWDFQDAIKER